MARRVFWGLNDTLAFNSAQKMGKEVADALDAARAGEAFKAGSEQTSTDVTSGGDAIAKFKDEYAKNWTPESGQPKSADDYIAANPEVFQNKGLTEQKAGKQYSIGTGDNFKQSDTEFTNTQKRASGLQALANYHYGMGDVAKGSDAESKAMALTMGEYSMKDAERKQRVAQRLEDVGKLWHNPAERLKSLYNTDEGKYGQGNDAGKQGQYKALPDGGALVWHTGPDGQQMGDAVRLSPDQLKQEIHKNMLTDMLAADPTNVPLLLEARKLDITADDVAARRDHYRAQGAHWEGDLAQRKVDSDRKEAQDKRMYDLQSKHFGITAQHQKEANELAKANLKLATDRYGVDSPQYKAEKLKYENEQEYSNGMTQIAQLMDNGADPSVVAKKADELGMKHQDKMPKIKSTDPVTGVTTETIVNPLTERLRGYSQTYAKAQTAMIAPAYDPAAGVQVVATPKGQVGYISARTPQGVVYKSEDEMKKKDKIKTREEMYGTTGKPPTPDEEDASSNEAVGGLNSTIDASRFGRRPTGLQR